MDKIIADLHSHTLASTHAYCTALEMITAAKNKGLKAIGLTDHARTMPGSPKEWFFECLDVIPDYDMGVRVYKGVELNVLDFEGNIDYEKEFKVDYAIASVHDIEAVNLQNPTIEKCTNMYLNLANNPKVHIIGHSGSPKFKYDYEKVIPIFGKNHKLVEINNNTYKARPANLANCKEIALVCKKYSVPIVVNSDAHYHTNVGDVDLAMKMLEEINFPQDLIVNLSMEKVEEFMNNYTNIKK